MKRPDCLQQLQFDKLRKVILLFCCLLGLAKLAAKAQTPISREGQYLKKGTLIFQCETASTGIVTQNQLTLQKETLYLFELGPKVGVFLRNQLSISADGYWGTVYGTLVEDTQYWGWGGSVKYYPFAKVRTSLMDGHPLWFLGNERLQKERDRRFVTKSLFPYMGMDFRNMEVPPFNHSSVIRVGPTRENAVRAYVGIIFRIFKGMSLETGVGAEYWNDGLGLRFGGPLSITYYLPLAKNEKGY